MISSQIVQFPDLFTGAVYSRQLSGGEGWVKYWDVREGGGHRSKPFQHKTTSWDTISTHGGFPQINVFHLLQRSL